MTKNEQNSELENNSELHAAQAVKLTLKERMTKWFSKYYWVFILAIVGLFIGTILFYNSKVSHIKKAFAIEKTSYEKVFAQRLDSVTTENAYQLSRVFSWSVRAELIRGNNEQVSLLFNQFVKTPSIKKIALIDPKTKEIIIASDKKIEGEFLKTLPKLTEKGGTVFNNELFLSITGLNEQIGILNIVYNLHENPNSQMNIKQ